MSCNCVAMCFTNCRLYILAIFTTHKLRIHFGNSLVDNNLILFVEYSSRMEKELSLDFKFNIQIYWGIQNY